MPDKQLWHEIYLNLAGAVALQGTCPRAQVGAVLVRAGRPLSVGYNGAPPGQPHCAELYSEHHHLAEGSCTNAIHAELNAIAWAARVGIPTSGAILYCTHAPCIPCGQAILSAGIVQVYYSVPYHNAFKFPDFMAHEVRMVDP